MADDDEHYDEALANDDDRAAHDDPYDDPEFRYDMWRIDDEDE